MICENLLEADKFLETLIKKELQEKEMERFNETVGLVEVSIGRMIPVMTPEKQDGNILRVWVEPYCELPVDKDAFKGEVPGVEHLLPYSPFAFYIQRKLFVHNMAHALTAYLGYLSGCRYVWEAIGRSEIKKVVRGAMLESAKALSAEHGVLEDRIIEYAEDLIYRFGNRYLGDTIERVEKDPVRKLSPNDRLVGAARLCERHGIKPINISRGIAAALCFNVESDPASQKLMNILKHGGPEKVLRDICNLDEKTEIFSEVLSAYRQMGV